MLGPGGAGGTASSSAAASSTTGSVSATANSAGGANGGYQGGALGGSATQPDRSRCSTRRLATIADMSSSASVAKCAVFTL